MFPVDVIRRMILSLVYVDNLLLGINAIYVSNLLKFKSNKIYILLRWGENCHIDRKLISIKVYVSYAFKRLR